MKLFNWLLISYLLVFTACNGKKNAEGGGRGPADSITIARTDTAGSRGSAPTIEELKEALGKLTPLTRSELQSRLPKELMGVTSNATEVSDGLGILSAFSDYKINDSTTIRLNIMDCAGSGGVGFFSMQYESMIQPEEADSETTYTIIDFRGYKATESCLKSDPGNCIFTFFTGRRFLVMIESRTAGIDLLKQIAGQLEVN